MIDSQGILGLDCRVLGIVKSGQIGNVDGMFNYICFDLKGLYSLGAFGTV